VAPVALEAAPEPAPAPVEPAPVPEPVQTEPAPVAEVPAEKPADAPKPPPYSLPFQLRPVVAASVIRSDTAFAFYKDPATKNSGSTIASMLLASYKVTDELAPMIRLGVSSNSPPDAPAGVPQVKSTTDFLNPVLGATYALKLGKEWKLAPFLGFTLPIGSGGGNSPKPEKVPARGAGMAARSNMDNAMFAVNDFAVFPGVGLAYVSGGLTAQVEATVFQLWRVRGEAVQPDESKTNFTTGLHVGYFFVPVFSFGAELRHQRWLSTPGAVKLNDKARETTTVAFGPRFHIKLGEKTWLRPGIAFAMPLDEPMSKSEHKVVQLDIPFAF
jgi:hypothetical protein